MIELKDWKVVLGWDATKVKQGMKSLDTAMKRVEKTNTRIADRKKKDEDKAWAQHRKQELAKQRMADAAYKQRDRQESLAAQKRLRNERIANTERERAIRRNEAAAKRQQRDQLAQLTFLRRQNRMMNDLRRMDGQVSSNLGRKAISPEQAATQRASIGAGLAMVGGASSAAQLAGVSRQFDNIINKGRIANKNANEHARAIQRANFAAHSLSGSIKNMAKSWLSIYAAFEGASAFYRVGVAFDSMNASMLAASGNSQAAAQNMEFLINTSKTLGTNLQSSVIGFNKLGVAARAAGFDQKQTQDMFLAVSESVTAFTLNDEQQKNIFYALSQMASKARISTEELQRQMGDYLPTAMQAMVRSYSDFSGKQVDAGMMLKLISDGKVMSKDVLPGFAKHLGLMAREGGALAAAMEKVGTQQKRFNTQVQLNVKDSFGESQGAFAMGWKELTEAMVQAKPVFMVFGKIFGGVFAGLAVVVRAIAPVIGIVATGFENLFKMWAGVGRTATDAMTKSGSQLDLWERAALIASAAAYGLAAAVYYIIGALEWLNEALQIKKGDNAWVRMGKTLGSFGTSVIAFIAIWKLGLGAVILKLGRIVGLARAASAALLGTSAASATTGATAATAAGSGLLAKAAMAAPFIAAAGATAYGYGNEMERREEGKIPLLNPHEMYGSIGRSAPPKVVKVEVTNQFNGASMADAKRASTAIITTVEDQLTMEGM